MDVAKGYYWRGVEDALKANPPLHPEVEVYMKGYNSLVLECDLYASDEF